MPRLPIEVTAAATAPAAACELAYVDARERVISTRTKNALKRVYDALRHLVDLGTSDFGVANVARAVEALHPGLGPKEQSIRNAEGRPYRELIAAFRLAYAREAPKAERRPAADDLLASIRDQAVATRVRELQLLVEELTRRNAYLKRQYDTLRAVDPRVLLGDPPRGEAPLSVAPALPPHQVRAVRDFLAHATDLLECQWDEATGELLTTTRHRVAGRGFRQALLAVSGEQGGQERSDDVAGFVRHEGLGQGAARQGPAPPGARES